MKKIILTITIVLMLPCRANNIDDIAHAFSDITSEPNKSEIYSVYSMINSAVLNLFNYKSAFDTRYDKQEWAISERIKHDSILDKLLQDISTINPNIINDLFYIKSDQMPHSLLSALAKDLGTYILPKDFTKIVTALLKKGADPFQKISWSSKGAYDINQNTINYDITSENVYTPFYYFLQNVNIGQDANILILNQYSDNNDKLKIKASELLYESKHKDKNNTIIKTYDKTLGDCINEISDEKIKKELKNLVQE